MTTQQRGGGACMGHTVPRDAEVGRACQVVAEAIRSDPKRCGAPRKDGHSCTVTTLLADGHCFAHSERAAAARTEARRKGGRQSAKVHRLRGLLPPRLVPAFDQLEQALSDVLAGSLDPKQATAAAAVAR